MRYDPVMRTALVCLLLATSLRAFDRTLDPDALQQAIALGGKLSRETLLSAMSKVDNWTCNNLHSRQHVGPRHTGDGWRFLQVKGGKYVPIGGTNYSYDGVTVVR